MYRNKIRMYRKEKGLTQKEIADKCGVSIGYMSHLENGTRVNPSTEIMEKIALVLGKSIADIFFSK